MGLFDKLKKTTSDVLGGETIGRVEGDRGREEQISKKTPKNKPKARKEPTMTKKKKGLLGGMFGDKNPKSNKKSPTKVKEMSDTDLLGAVGNSSEEDEDVSKYIKTDKAGGRTRKTILSQLNIDEKAIIPNELITIEQIEAVEFTPTVPSGLSVEEVSRFCDQMEVEIERYRNVLISASEDKEKLIDELLRVERQILEDRNQEVLDSFISNGNTEREKLNESLITTQLANKELQDENEKLKRQFSSGSRPDKQLVAETSQLKAEVASLQSKLSNAAALTATPPDDELIKKLTDAEKLNAKLSKTVEELKISADDKAAAEELRKLREENERLRKSVPNGDAVNAQQVKALQDENRQLVSKIEKLSKPEINTPEDFEKKVMAQFQEQHGAVNKHVRKEMTAEEIQAMKKAQEDGDIVIKGFEQPQNPPADSGDIFKNMMAEFNED